MMPESIRADSQVTLNDSCNNCCCFNFRSRRKTQEKTAIQSTKIIRQDSPRRAERSVTQIHLDVTTTDDVEFVQDYKISPKKVL